MEYTLVHLSDLHYRTGWDEANGVVCEAFLTDLATECPKTSNVYAAFSGDLVYAADDLQGYAGFLTRLGKGLDGAGIGRPRRFAIPGNHDVSRQALNTLLALHNGALSALHGEGAFNNNLPALTSQYFDAKFQKYRDCEKQFAEYQCCGTQVGGCGWDLPGDLGVYCLNTALTSCAGLEDENGKKITDEKRLCVDTRHLHRWLPASESKFRVLLAHHPLNWLADWAKTELERTIAKHFHLVLTGHVHTVDSFTTTRSIRQTVFCAAPALFTHKGETLGYALINLNTEDGAITVR